MALLSRSVNQSESCSGKQLEHSDGYDIDTIDKVQQDFFCPICLKLMRNVKQLDCGHVFCDGCLQKHLKTLTERGTVFFCPVDRKPVSSKHIVSVPFIDRLILSTKVKCTYGCDWVGELGNLKDHQPHCEYLPIKCPNKKCCKRIQRKKMDEHIETCKYTLLQCKYHHYGCKIKLSRQEVSKHEKIHNKIEKLEDSHRSLRGSYTEVQANALELQIELDKVILHKRILQDKINYLKTTNDEEMKKQEQKFADVKRKNDNEMKKQEQNFADAKRKYDNECGKVLYYYGCWEEKEEQFQKLLKENENQSKLMKLEVSKHEIAHQKIEQQESSYKWLQGRYIKVQANALEQQNELDKVTLHNRILQDKIKNLKATNDEEIKKQGQKIENECEKALYYYKLSKEKEKQYQLLFEENEKRHQKMIAENKEVNDTNCCNTFFCLLIFISMVAFYYKKFLIIDT